MELAQRTLGLLVLSKCLVQFLLVQVGTLRPREGKGFAQSPTANWGQTLELSSGYP